MFLTEEELDKQALQEAINERDAINKKIYLLAKKQPADQDEVEKFVKHCVQEYRQETPDMRIPSSLEHARYYKLSYLPSLIKKYLPKISEELHLFTSHLKQCRKISSMLTAFKMLAQAQTLLEKQQRDSSLLEQQEAWHSSEKYFGRVVELEYELEEKEQQIHSFMQACDRDWLIGKLIEEWPTADKEKRKELVLPLYNDFGMSHRDIASLVGVGKSTIFRLLS